MAFATPVFLLFVSIAGLYYSNYYGDIDRDRTLNLIEERLDAHDTDLEEDEGKLEDLKIFKLLHEASHDDVDHGMQELYKRRD